MLVEMQCYIFLLNLVVCCPLARAFWNDIVFVLTFIIQVFAFGSVPLRTYLPDGDVDITVLGNTWLNSTLIDDVRSMLQSEQENCDAELKLTGLHFIDAEVRCILHIYIYMCILTFNPLLCQSSWYIYLIHITFLLAHFDIARVLTLIWFYSTTRLSS